MLWFVASCDVGVHRRCLHCRNSLTQPESIQSVLDISKERVVPLDMKVEEDGCSLRRRVEWLSHTSYETGTNRGVRVFDMDDEVGAGEGQTWKAGIEFPAGRLTHIIDILLSQSKL
jgi:hypothetical protein